MRWVYSTNHEDIGTLYLILAADGGFLSVVMRWGNRLQLFHGLACLAGLLRSSNPPADEATVPQHPS